MCLQNITIGELLAWKHYYYPIHDSALTVDNFICTCTCTCTMHVICTCMYVRLRICTMYMWEKSANRVSSLGHNLRALAVLIWLNNVQNIDSLAFVLNLYEL